MPVLRRFPFRACALPLLAATLLLSGCAAWRSTDGPMAVRVLPSACSAPGDTLVVFLPGAYSDPQEFVDEGFVDALRQRRIAADVMLVDAHLAYYTQGKILERLEADVFAPAKAHGYRSIWLVGISAGGLGALIHEAEHPGEVAGIVAIAPYLGERMQSQDVANAGGLQAWQGPLDARPSDAMDLKLWRWLKGHTGGTTTPAGRTTSSGTLPPLYLGYGTDDRFAFSQRLLADALPVDRVFTTPGGHDWPPWRRLWLQMLEELPLPVCR